MGDIYTRICKDCKKTFKTDKPAAQYCPECKAEHRQKTWDKYKEQLKKPKAEARKKSPELWNDTKDLDAFNRLCELYNKNHGTNYSYGQFELQRFLGKINIREVQ